MTEYLLFAVLGLGAGTVYAGLGMGLVTVHKASGVVNLAQASLGLWGAFTYSELRVSGRLVLPVIGMPGALTLGGPFSLWPALLLGVLSSAALGALVHLLVFRPLRHASGVAKIMAAVGVLTLTQTVLGRRFGADARTVEPLLPADPIGLGTLGFPSDRLWLLAVTVLVAVSLAAYFRFTNLGLATRASVEDEVALALARWSPTLLATANWALGCAVTALLLTLAAPVTTLNPSSIGLLIVPGLAVMLIGRLSSVTAAAAGGLALGVLQSELNFLQLQPWWPATLPAGLTEAVPFVVIVTVLVVAGRRLPGRGALVLHPLPAVVRRPVPAGVLLGGGVATAAAITVLPATARGGVVASMIFAIVALSFVVLVGLVGQVSLGQAGVAGTAAFTLARVTDGLPFPLSIAAAASVATVTGVLMGLPALRIRGAQLTVVTLAGAAALETLVLRNVAADPAQTALTPPRVGPVDLAVQQGSDIARTPFALAVLVVLLLCCSAVSRIITGTTGRRMLAVRANERAAASVGIDVARTKLLAFAVSSFVVGLGGALLAHSRGAVSVESFGFFAGITFLVFAFIGGITSVGGALLGGVAAPLGIGYVLADRVVGLGSVYDVVGGLGMILAAVFQPEGAAGALGQARTRLRRGCAAAPPPPLVVPATPADSDGDRSRPALELRGVSVHYQGVRAVDDVHLVVEAGSVHGLIGPNGAGKTSTLDAITGFAPYDGEVLLRGERVDRLPPHRRYGRGLARTWQSTEVFDDLSVLDNVLVAGRAPCRGDLLRDLFTTTRTSELDAAWALELLGIADLAHRSPRELSTGQQKLVGVARALATRPAVLLADEPAAGLDTAESRQLGQHLLAIARAGIAVVLVEHDLSLVLEVCDAVTVLDFGGVIATGSPAQVRQDSAVLAAYVGTAVAAEKGAPASGTRDVLPVLVEESS